MLYSIFAELRKVTSVFFSFSFYKIIYKSPFIIISYTYLFHISVRSIQHCSRHTQSHLWGYYRYLRSNTVSPCIRFDLKKEMVIKLLYNVRNKSSCWVSTCNRFRVTIKKWLSIFQWMYTYTTKSDSNNLNHRGRTVYLSDSLGLPRTPYIDICRTRPC